jgi:TonB family protein
MHFVFLLAIFWTVHSRFQDLTMVTLDWIPSKAARSHPPINDYYWQKPMLRHLSRLALKPKPTPIPTPDMGNEGEGLRSVAEVSQLPHFKIQVKPVYPEAARHSGIEGVVILQVDIDANGAVMNVEVAQSLGSGCDEAAVAAMRQSSFDPARVGFDPVPVRIRIPYRFKIND